MTRRCLFVFVFMLVIACGRESAPPPARPITLPAAPRRVVVEAPPAGAGCYVIEWRSRKPLPHYGIPLPRAIELTAMPAARDVGGFLIRSRDGVNAHEFADWKLTAASRLELSWSTGFVGFSISVPSEFKNGAAEGVAQTFSDVPEPGESAKVRVVRVGC